MFIYIYTKDIYIFLISRHNSQRAGYQRKRCVWSYCSSHYIQFLRHFVLKRSWSCCCCCCVVVLAELYTPFYHCHRVINSSIIHTIWIHLLGRQRTCSSSDVTRGRGLRWSLTIRVTWWQVITTAAYGSPYARLSFFTKYMRNGIYQLSAYFSTFFFSYFLYNKSFTMTTLHNTLCLDVTFE